MRTLISLIVIFILATFFSIAGEPVPGAEVYIEQETGKEPIAFQQTGDSGTASFAYLDKGVYRVYLVLPRQRGKLAGGDEKVECDLMAGYHADKKTYFLQQPEGYFTVQFSGFKKLAASGFAPGFGDRSRGSNRILVGTFEVDGNNGSITLAIEAETAKTFAKNVMKVKHDAAMSAIRNMK